MYNQVFEFSQCPLYLNNVLIFASTIRVNISNSLDPLYVVNSPNSQGVVSANGLKVDLDIAFYPVFNDPFYLAISNKQAINLNLGGIQFNGGAISNFNLQGTYGNLVQGTTKATFYSPFQGVFNPSSFIQTVNNSILNPNWQIASTSLTQLLNNFNVTIPMGFSFQYSTQFSPIYRVGSSQCQGIKYDKSKISASVQGEAIQNFVSTQGNQGTISINLKDICGNSLSAIRTKFSDEIGDWCNDITYTCAGQIDVFDMDVSSNEIIKGTVGVTQFV